MKKKQPLIANSFPPSDWPKKTMLRIGIFCAAIVLIFSTVAASLILSNHFGKNSEIKSTFLLPMLSANTNQETTVGVTFEHAPQLPVRPIDTWGVLLSEENGRYLVGSGPNSVNVQEINGRLEYIPWHEGPQIEVVANHDTLFYEDITPLNLADLGNASGEVRVQQHLHAVARPKAMPPAANLIAWGEKRGERLIAQIIVFRDEGYAISEIRP